VRHCRKPRWWKSTPAKEEKVWRILELIDQVAQGKQGEGQERNDLASFEAKLEKGKFQPKAPSGAIGKLASDEANLPKGKSGPEKIKALK
jgi:hypothetical protein